MQASIFHVRFLPILVTLYSIAQLGFFFLSFKAFKGIFLFLHPALNAYKYEPRLKGRANGRTCAKRELWKFFFFYPGFPLINIKFSCGYKKLSRFFTFEILYEFKYALEILFSSKFALLWASFCVGSLSQYFSALEIVFKTSAGHLVNNVLKLCEWKYNYLT